MLQACKCPNLITLTCYCNLCIPCLHLIMLNTENGFVWLFRVFRAKTTIYSNAFYLFYQMGSFGHFMFLAFNFISLELAKDGSHQPDYNILS